MSVTAGIMAGVNAYARELEVRSPFSIKGWEYTPFPIFRNMFLCAAWPMSLPAMAIAAVFGVVARRRKRALRAEEEDRKLLKEMGL